AASRDGFDVDWPISHDDVKPYYDKVDRLLGCSGTNEGLEQVPDGVFQRPYKLNCVEVAFKRAIAKMGRHYIPGRAGVTTDGVLNKYRAKCAGRGRCGRGCDIQAAFHSPTALIYPARDTGHVTVRPYSIVSEVLVDESTNKATGVRVIDANTRAVMDFTARGIVLGAGTLDTTRILLNSRSRAYPTGVGNSSGVLGCYLSEHIMGIRGSGYVPARIGTETTLDDGRPVAPYIPRSRRQGRVGHSGPALRLQVPRQRAEDGEGHGRLDRGDADGGGRRRHQDRARAAAARVVDSRDWHRAHG